MKAVNKNELLDRLEKEVEKHIQLVNLNFSGKEAAALLRAAQNGGWGVAQCVEHLNTYGNFYLPEIKKSIGRGNRAADNGLFKSSWLGARFTNMMDPSIGTKKYKAFKGHSPAADLDATAVLAEYLDQQRQMLTYLKQARMVNLRRSKVPMSIASWVKLPLGDIFQFMIAHDKRHIQQALRSMSA